MPESVNRVNADDYLNRICSECYRPVYRFAYRLLGDGEEAADVAQEAFVRLHRLANSENEIPINPQAWLFCVARNLCRDRMRRRGLFRRLFHNPNHLPRDVASSEAQAVQEETRRRVRSEMERLSVRDRLLLNLYQDDFTYAEMARIAGMKETSVGKALSRALARLGKRLSTGDES